MRKCTVIAVRILKQQISFIFTDHCMFRCFDILLSQGWVPVLAAPNLTSPTRQLVVSGGGDKTPHTNRNGFGTRGVTLGLLG